MWSAWLELEHCRAISPTPPHISLYLPAPQVSVGSSLDIGEFENLAHYDRLAQASPNPSPSPRRDPNSIWGGSNPTPSPAQEVATALIAPANAALVGTSLLPMFLPATASTAPATGTAAPATATAAPASRRK